MKIFILDDDEMRHQSIMRKYPKYTFVRAHGALDAMKKLEEGPFDMAFFDHDLGDWYKEQNADGVEVIRERTGLDVIEHLLERVHPAKWPEDVIVHSWNGTRGRLMTDLLVKNGVSAIYQPFTP